MQRIILDTPEGLAKINELLREYAGFPIKLWSYSVSLSRLQLRIERGAAGNFHLQMMGVESLILPKLRWELGGRIENDESRPLSGPRYTFTDGTASARIECGGVRLEENVEPLYR